MTQAQENQKKYLRAPTIEEINLVLDDLGVTASHFERFFNIYERCIAQLRMGERANVYSEKFDTFYRRRLPAKYWHLIFENLPEKRKKQVNNFVNIPSPPKPKPKIKFKRAKKKKKVVMDEKILALL